MFSHHYKWENREMRKGLGKGSVVQ
jgi:hypothetical protein